MGSASRYWRLVKIDATGQRRVDEWAIAKTFFQQALTPWVDATDLADPPVHQELMDWVQRDMAPTNTDGEQAASCLRCYISEEIEQECIRLERKFGERYGVSRRDLFPFVLDDDGRKPFFSSLSDAYLPLAFEVIKTFNPTQAKLNTWVIRLLKSRRTLNQFLRECGVYLESDWSILCQTNPDQLRRILSEFHTLTSEEVAIACAILKAYHQVYRQDRLMQRHQGILKGKEKCAPPTVDQLTRMGQHLSASVPLKLTNDGILSRLQAIATQVRQSRLSTPTMTSLDQFEKPVEVASPEPDDTETEQQDFLIFYREQLMVCLDDAIAQAVSDRLAYLQRKKPQNVELYLQALQLFHCRGMSMGAIARELQMRAQDAVTRLLELKPFRASVRQKLLMLLCDRLLDKAKTYASANCLHTLEQQLETVLDEQIATVMQQAENEALVARDRPLESLFARRLCHYLDRRSTAS
jgi:hypothetical protein